MKKAIVLGGTLPHVSLIQKLKKRGFYIILLDYLNNPYAKSYADKHIQESTLDLDVVLKIAQKEKVDLVISTCIDQANTTACYVSEKLGLTRPYDYETALAVTDKEKMKTIMLENNIPTSKFVKVKSVDNMDLSSLVFPLIVKPIDCNSSKGVRKIERKDPNAEKAINEAISMSRNHEAIIEEYVSGKEIGIDTFVINGEAKVLMIKERRKVTKNSGGVEQILGCTWPMPGYEAIEKQANEIANKIAKAFKLKCCPLMIQAILKDNKINVIEFGARIGGGESFRIIKKSTSFDYLEASINSFLGEPVSQDYHIPRSFYADNFIYAKKCKFGRVYCPQYLLENGVVSYVNELKTSGTDIDDKISSNNRVGVIVIEAKNEEDLYQKIDLTIKSIEVYDINNNPVMRKDIYQ